MNKWLICKNNVNIYYNSSVYMCRCDVCGYFKITEEAADDFRYFKRFE